MRKLLTAALAVALVGLAAAPAAGAKERLLTLLLAQDRLAAVRARHARGRRSRPTASGRPSSPATSSGFKEMALVDSKDPKAKPLPIAKMMVHHFLYFAPGRVDQGAGQLLAAAWASSAAAARSTRSGHTQLSFPKSARNTYGINNRKADGSAPDWRLTAMVMNHYKRPKSFYVRMRVYYTTEQRKSVLPIVIGDCAQLAQRHVLRRAGRRPQGLQLRRLERLGRPVQRPDAGRLVAPARRRQVPDARQPHLPAPPVQGARLPRAAEPSLQPDPADPARAGADRHRRVRDARGHPASRRARCCAAPRSTTTTTCTWPSMGFWATWFVEDESVKRCGKLPNDIVEINKPKRYDRTPNYDLVVPQLSKPRGAMTAFDGERAPDRRRLLPSGQADRQGRPDADLDASAARSRTASRWPTGRAASRRSTGADARRVQLHAEGEGHLQARLPGPPDDDGADARGQVAARTGRCRGGCRSPRPRPGRPTRARCGWSPSAAAPRVVAARGQDRQRAALLGGAPGSEQAPSRGRGEPLQAVDHDRGVPAALYHPLGALDRQLGSLRLAPPATARSCRPRPARRPRAPLADLLGPHADQHDLDARPRGGSRPAPPRSRAAASWRRLPGGR